MLALADTHLRSIRQLLATWLLVIALFTAAEPVSVSVPLWIATALVVHGFAAWARHTLAAGTMRWGDWIRQGWRTVGADLAGACNRPPREQAVSAVGIRTLGRLRLATFTLVVIDVAVLARAATLIDPDLLPPFATFSRFAALAAAVVCIVALIDVMQVVVRRRQRRADPRIAVALVRDRRRRVLRDARPVAGRRGPRALRRPTRGILHRRDGRRTGGRRLDRRGGARRHGPPFAPAPRRG